MKGRRQRTTVTIHLDPVEADSFVNAAFVCTSAYGHRNAERALSAVKAAIRQARNRGNRDPTCPQPQ